MKRIIVLAMVLLMASNSFSQHLPSEEFLSRQDYLKKSKNQKTVAWILLAGGVGLIGTGLLIGNGDESSFDDAASGGIIAGAGIASALVSVPLFIASKRNQTKAMQLSAGLQRQLVPVQTATTFRQHARPTLSMKLNF